MFFKREEINKNNMRGLCVGVDELIAQRKFLPYIKQRHNNITSYQAGDIRSAFKGRGMELEEVRSYGYGDDVRDIDWRVTARKGDTYTKVFSEEKDREVYVVLDVSPYMLFGTKKELKSVSAAKLTALLGWQSLANKDRFGLILFDGYETKMFKPQNNQKNLMAIFNAISETSSAILSYKYNPNKLKDLSKKFKYQALSFEELKITSRGTLSAYGQTVPYAKFEAKVSKLPFSNVAGIVASIKTSDGSEKLAISVNENSKYSQLIADEFFKGVKEN